MFVALINKIREKKITSRSLHISAIYHFFCVRPKTTTLCANLHFAKNEFLFFATTEIDLLLDAACCSQTDRLRRRCQKFLFHYQVQRLLLTVSQQNGKSKRTQLDTTESAPTRDFVILLFTCTQFMDSYSKRRINPDHWVMIW